MADNQVAISVLSWLEQHQALSGLPVTLEAAPPEGTDGVTLSSLTGDPIIKRYKSGGYVAAYPFSVMLRVNHADTQRHIDAIGVLGDIAASIEEKAGWPVAPDGFDYHTIETRTLPVLASRTDSGADDYQVTFTLTYRKRG